MGRWGKGGGGIKGAVSRECGELKVKQDLKMATKHNYNKKTSLYCH